MRITDSMALAGDSLRNNKLRTFLTLLGIMIGIAAVIVLAGVGAGTRSQILAELNSQVGNQVMIMPLFSNDNRQIVMPGPKDVEALQRYTEAEVAPVTYLQMRLWRLGKQYFPNVTGTTFAYFKMQRRQPRLGRFLSAAEDAGASRVCVLGSTTADRLFGVANPVGQWLRLGGERFRVVGVLAAKNEENSLLGSMGGGRLEIYVPVATMQAMTGMEQYFMIILEPPTPAATDGVMAAAKTALARVHGPKETFTIMSTEQILKVIGSMTIILTVLLIAVGAIALVVGGIGIMNIMLVSVTERTQEIGTRKALGAKRADIMGQFIMEAVFLCLCGAFCGILAGIGGAKIVAVATPVKPLMSWWIYLLAVGFAVGIGMLFGTYPALRAARLDPIEALRKE